MNGDTEKEAIKFARNERQRIAKEFTNKEKYSPEIIPISVFMAGSPGAGKTEFSNELINLLERENERKVIKIDPDELRKYCPGYTGSNSSVFNTAVTLIVERIHDLTLENNQSFLLDGTFSNYEKAKDNIKRSVSRNRVVIVFYVYQRPEIAWKFTEAREVLEGRNIPKASFIRQFIDSRNVVERVRKDFSDEELMIFIVKKNFETHKVDNIISYKQDSGDIDQYVAKRYTEDELRNIL